MKLLVVTAVILAALVFGWCSPKVWDEVNLMPPPDVFGDGLLNPLPYEEPMKDIPYGGMLYATDRAPATDDDRENYYLNDRGQVLRLGVANISLHEPQVSWEEIRNRTLLKNRVRNYPLRVTGIDEFGVLEDSIPAFADPDKFDSDARDGDDQYAAAINAQLARSGRRDIYVYVHGYRVVFENPMLVASELWHFRGYDGVMIGYAWPSTPSKWAYLRDTDTSNGFARHFRLFLKFLSEHTDAEAIHVIGYSAGTRMVARAYEQIALMYNDKSREQFQGKFRLGNLILVGSDLDRDVFSTYLADGALDVPKHLSVYVSTRPDLRGKFLVADQLSPVE
jgi:esterase/lipase superfamily enzyme